jgi:hypothetical protein
MEPRQSPPTSMSVPASNPRVSPLAREDVVLLAYGLPIEMIAEVVRPGFAVAQPGLLLAGQVSEHKALDHRGRAACAGGTVRHP